VAVVVEVGRHNGFRAQTHRGQDRGRKIKTLLLSSLVLRVTGVRVTGQIECQERA
jgi:hypothetical protein